MALFELLNLHHYTDSIEYGMNVQEFTYHKIKESLPPDMSIETEEVDDDDAIQLVINIQ